MKKLKLLTAIFMISGTLASKAQVGIEVVPLFGTVFQSTYYGYDGRIVFGTGMAYGGLLNFKLNPYVDIGFNVINQDSKATLYYDSYTLGGYYEEDFEVGIINYQLSLVRNFADASKSKVIPFFGMDIGVVQLYEKNASSVDYVKMSIGFKGGIKLQLTNRINLRVQPQLEMPIQGVGVGVSYGSGGASMGTTTYASLVQFGILGGLGFTIK